MPESPGPFFLVCEDLATAVVGPFSSLVEADKHETWLIEQGAVASTRVIDLSTAIDPSVDKEQIAAILQAA
jgi:hypothetical protein